jgi:hypothetical protein
MTFARRPLRPLLLVCCLLAGVAAGCASGSDHSAPSAPPAPPADAASEPNTWGTSAGPAPAAAPPSADRGAPPGGSAAEAAREERPGLATHWGETRSSFVRTTSFDRADGAAPFASASIYYNNRSGARALVAGEGGRRGGFAALELASGGLTVTLRDEGGATLPAVASAERLVAVGDAGSRYTIVLANHTPARFEAVVSVDGLDVLDGREASLSKRGYVVGPHATVEIDGFRRSESAVAAFRFGSVAGSYAARKGDDRNVGVVGVALFHEAGTEPWPWRDDEARRRRGAQPFPGRFAEPPP